MGSSAVGNAAGRRAGVHPRRLRAGGRALKRRRRGPDRRPARRRTRRGRGGGFDPRARRTWESFGAPASGFTDGGRPGERRWRSGARPEATGRANPRTRLTYLVRLILSLRVDRSRSHSLPSRISSSPCPLIRRTLSLLTVPLAGGPSDV